MPNNDRLSRNAGVRLWRVDVDAPIVGGGPLGDKLGRSGDKNWVDPLVGARCALPVAKDWTLISKADVGEFGVGGDFARQASLFTDWRF